MQMLPPNQHTDINSPSTWTPSQRVQHIAESLRDKGALCRDFLETGSCPRTSGPMKTSMCPYRHVANGEVLELPGKTCHFVGSKKCLRDKCAFFHGSREQLELLWASGATTYRPQDYMPVVSPPAEFVNQDGTISDKAQVASLPLRLNSPVVRPPRVANPAVYSPIYVIHDYALPTFPQSAAIQYIQPPAISYPLTTVPQFAPAGFQALAFQPFIASPPPPPAIPPQPSPMPQQQYHYAPPPPYPAAPEHPTDSAGLPEGGYMPSL